MPKIKGWDRRVTRSSPDKKNYMIAKWISIYGDEVAVCRTHAQERFEKLNGEPVTQYYYPSGSELEDKDKEKWYVHKIGSAEPKEYYSTRKAAMDAAKKEIRELYPDHMIEQDLQARRRERQKLRDS